MAPELNSQLLGLEKDSDELCSLFDCLLCGDLLLEPVTLPCCGKVFCRECLRDAIRAKVSKVGLASCPNGCERKFSVRLPTVSSCIEAAIRLLLPKELKRREEEDREERLRRGPQIAIGGFVPWQEVVAFMDITFENSREQIGVEKGTPGICIDMTADRQHLVVKFDSRKDGSELCVNVIPEALRYPLPGALRLGQRVVALCDLIVGKEKSVMLGGGGQILERHDEHNLLIQFDKRHDNLSGPVIVDYRMVQAERRLVGGFLIGQEIQAAVDLKVGEGDDKVVAMAGSRGTVVAEFSDSRITVLLEHERCVNVTPAEIVPWCELPDDLPVDTQVESDVDLVGHPSVGLLQKGTAGAVISGVSKTQVLVAFEVTPMNTEDFYADEPPPLRLIVDLGVLKIKDTQKHSRHAKATAILP